MPRTTYVSVEADPTPVEHLVGTIDPADTLTLAL